MSVNTRICSFRHQFLTNHTQAFEGDTDTSPLFTVRNKLSLGGPRMAVKFSNFDDKPVKLQVRGKLLDSGGKIMLNDQPVARFEGGVAQPMAGQPGRLETVSKITVAPLGRSVHPINTLRR